MAGSDDARGAATGTPTAAPGGASSGDGGGDDASEGELIAMGELIGVDAFHTGSGQVLLVRAPDGSLVLRFQDYEVRNGPGLYIYLTPDRDGDVHADGAIELEKIKATRGFVNYDVPPDVDPSTLSGGRDLLQAVRRRIRYRGLRVALEAAPRLPARGAGGERRPAARSRTR